MNPIATLPPLRRSILLGLLAGTTLGFAAPADELEDRQQAVRQKISELFAYRDEPPPQLTAEQNPFFRDKTKEPLDESATSVVTAKDEIIDPSLSPDERILGQLIKIIQVNGVVTIGDRNFIVINQTPIPVGGLAIIEYDGVSRPLRVENISVGEVTLSHGSARMIFVY